MTTWTRACMCRGFVTANPIDPFPGVALHVGTEPHRSWSKRHALEPLPSLPDSTADYHRVDLSAVVSVRPVRRRRPWVRLGGRKGA